MKTIKRVSLLLLLAITFSLGLSSCVVGYYGPAPYRYHAHANRYHGYGYYHHSNYGSHHRGMRHYAGRPRQRFGTR